MSSGGQFGGGDGICIISDGRDGLYLAVPDTGGNRKDVTRGYIRLSLGGKNYRMYRSQYLVCPVCFEIKWIVCDAISDIRERDCKCIEPAGLPGITYRISGALESAAKCPECGLAPRIDMMPDGEARFTNHDEDCPYLKRRTSTEAWMDVLYAVREDYMRRRAEANLAPAGMPQAASTGSSPPNPSAGC